MNHSTFETLVAYLEETLAATERQSIERHLENCPACRRELESARRVLCDVQAAELAAPPENLVDRVVSAFRRKQERRPNPQPRPAILAFDSWMRLAALGVRGMPQERQFLYSEGTVDLDVQVTRDEATEALILQGQILDSTSQEENLEGIEVRIANGDGVERRGLTDRLGRFSFTYVKPGTYTLRVLFADHDMVLDELKLGE